MSNKLHDCHKFTFIIDKLILNYLISGNIALHIFSTTIREKYDLETLWSVGPTYDKIVNTPDHDIEFQESYSDYLAGFQPADENAPSSKPDVL